jgi:hypothetical protein
VWGGGGLPPSLRSHHPFSPLPLLFSLDSHTHFPPLLRSACFGLAAVTIILIAGPLRLLKLLCGLLISLLARIPVIGGPIKSLGHMAGCLDLEGGAKDDPWDAGFGGGEGGDGGGEAMGSLSLERASGLHARGRSPGPAGGVGSSSSGGGGIGAGYAGSLGSSSSSSSGVDARGSSGEKPGRMKLGGSVGASSRGASAAPAGGAGSSSSSSSSAAAAAAAASSGSRASSQQPAAKVEQQGGWGDEAWEDSLLNEMEEADGGGKANKEGEGW